MSYFDSSAQTTADSWDPLLAGLELSGRAHKLAVREVRSFLSNPEIKAGAKNIHDLFTRIHAIDKDIALWKYDEAWDLYDELKTTTLVSGNRHDAHFLVQKIQRQMPGYGEKMAAFQNAQKQLLTELREEEVALGAAVRATSPGLTLFWLGPRPRKSSYEDSMFETPVEATVFFGEALEAISEGESLTFSDLDGFAESHSRLYNGLTYDPIAKKSEVPRIIYDRMAGTVATAVIASGVHPLSRSNTKIRSFEFGQAKWTGGHADYFLAPHFYREQLHTDISHPQGLFARFYDEASIAEAQTVIGPGLELGS